MSPVTTGGNRARALTGFERNAATEAVLQRAVSSFIYEEAAFSDVMTDLREGYKLNVELDQSALDGDLNADTAVSCHLSEVPLGEALERLLEKHNSTFIVDCGIVRIISRDVASDVEFFEQRVFDCASLVSVLPRQLSDRIAGGAAQNTAGAGGRTGLPNGMIATAEEQPDAVQTDKVVLNTGSLTTLESLVTQLVDSNVWAHFGNGDAVLWEVNGRLVVSAPGRTMRKVRSLLEYLESAYGIER